MKKYLGNASLGALVALGLVLSSGLKPAEAALIAHWEFDETSGTNAADSAGSNDATLRSDDSTTPDEVPAWDNTTDDFGAAFDSPGKVGPGYLQLNNTTNSGGTASKPGGNDYAVAETFKGIAGSASRTVAAWIRIDSNMVKDPVIIAWGDNVAVVPGDIWRFRLDGGNGDNADEYRLKIEGAGTAAVQGLVDIPLTTWTHVAVVFDSSLDPLVEDNMFLYVNGVRDDPVTLGNKNTTINTGVLNSVIIGSHYGHQGRSFNGGLDDVRIYDEALSATAIRDLAVVPEPSSFLLLGLGSLLIGGVSRRRS